MKRVIQLFTLVALPFALVAQSNFIRTIGGLGDDRGHGVTNTQEGGYVVVGFTNSFGEGGNDIFAIKTDADGAILWQKTYGGAQNDDGQSVTVKEAPNGDLLIMGVTVSFGGTRKNVLIIRTDSDGNQIWASMYDSGPNGNSANSDVGRGILFTRDGGIVISGSDDRRVFGENDGFVMKLSAAGMLQWKHVYGGNADNNDHMAQMAELPGGNILVSGSSRSFSSSLIDAYLVKLDPDGNVLWSYVYGGSQTEGSGNMELLGDTLIILTGVTTTFGAGGSDIYLMGVDTSGTMLWARTYGGAGNESGDAFRAYEDGSGFIVFSQTTSFSSNPDIMALRTDLQGNVLWAKTFDSGGDERIDVWANEGIQTTDDHGFILTGWSDNLSNTGNDIVLIKSDAEGSIFCNDVEVMTSIPDFFTIEAETLIAEGSQYSTVNPITGTSAMVADDKCCGTGGECVHCEKTIVSFNLNACYSNTGDGSNMDYSEFTPEYTEALSYAEISSSNVFRVNNPMNKHSCTPGVENSPAMCIGSVHSCAYIAGHTASVIFEVTIEPSPDSAVEVSSLSFFEKAPQIFDWIGGASGPNDYPTRFAVRVLKNGTEIYRMTDLPTSVDVWNEEVFDFSGTPEFLITDSTVLRIELLGYCVVGNGADVDAWDLDEIQLHVSCDAHTSEDITITGFVRDNGGHGMAGVIMSLSDTPEFESPVYAISDVSGRYTFHPSGSGNEMYYIKGLMNINMMQGVSTLDLVRVQKHLLGILPFDSPYQYLAADVNRTNSVSVQDLVVLRELVLGKIHAFPDNTSWRFGKRNHALTMADPWDFYENMDIPNAGIDVGNAHFIALKVGDVTGDANPGIQSPVQIRGNETLRIPDEEIRAGEQILLPVYASELNSFEGFQCAFDLHGLHVLRVEAGAFSISEQDYFAAPDGTLRISWSTPEAIDIEEDRPLFSIVFRAEQNGRATHMVNLNSAILPGEMYVDGGVRTLALSEFGGTADVLPEGEAVMNYPNPFSGQTTLRLFLKEQTSVVMRFFDASGRLLLTREGDFSSGLHEMQLSRADLDGAAGIILGEVRTQTSVLRRKFIVLD